MVTQTSWKLLGKILEDARSITPDQLRAALKFQSENPGRKIGDILLEMKAITSSQLAKALAVQHSVPFLELNGTEVSEEAVQAILPALAREHKIMPIKKTGKVLTIAMADPMDVYTLDNLHFILNMDIEYVIATKEDIQHAINRHYGEEEKGHLSELIEQATMTQTEIKLRTEDLEADAELLQDDEAPVIKFVHLMITEALRARASDIHVEPFEDRLRVRYRIDGVCQEVQSPPKRLQYSIIARIKIMAKMDIAEKRKPQDGRIQLTVLERPLDIRVANIPSVHGESIVMRLLDKQTNLVGLEELGFHPTDYQRFKNIIKRPNGIVLVTGPTGSGKTTTLYAALKELNRTDVKIITAEDPVEYNLPGINQAQVKAQIGMTFARILRAMLRQAPNIILVGEIRDVETAEIAIQAALTGHLVFSTLHTNDAPGALTRLLDMGVKPFLVASSIQAVLAQRLVRMLCEACREPTEPDIGLLAAMGLKPEQVKEHTLYRPVGCSKCRKSGYKGRKGIFEFMELNSTLRDMIFHKQSLDKIREAARLNGMTTLLEDAVRKVLDGLTTVEEVVSITHRQDIQYV